MPATPKWYLPVAITALLWNLMGCAAYIADVLLTPEDIAAMSAAQQTMYASRPAWAVGATAIAVWGGAAGSLGLILRKRWATLLFAFSLAALIVQDLWLFVLTDAGTQSGSVPIVLQSLVFLIAIGLVFLGRHAAAQEWIA
jgi:hypothetical protein